MSVTARAAVAQGKVDHRPQRQCRREGMLAGERLGGWYEDIVMVSVQLISALQHKVRCPIRGWP